MKLRYIFTAALLALAAVPLAAQNETTPGESANAIPDTLFKIRDYNAELPTGTDILAQGSELKPVKRFHPTHLIGVRYGVSYSTAGFSPDVSPKKIICPNSFGLAYTCYTDLWDMLNNFGFQVNAMMVQEGYDAEYIDGERYTVAQAAMLCNFHLDFSRFRIIANVGPYAGYRVANGRLDKEWRDTDNRFDYGITAGGGLAAGIGPFELQLEASYKYGLSSYFHTFYYSDEYWLFAYPRVLMATATLYYKFQWGKK
ncbi:MAG: hypothetical protein HUJ91_05505 [Bacteroidales bacterium]|nr:hypothetical protein [Bacteroidales bacterium]